MKRTVFDIYHPLVAALYLSAALVFSMVALQPVYLAINAITAIVFNIALRGIRANAQTLKWQIPLLLLIAIVNPLLTQSGSTVLFMWGGHNAFFLESAIYGVCMGAMLVTVLQWFSSFARIMTSDKVMQLTGNVMPTIGLMITMILRLVPQFVRRGTAIRSAQEACTASHFKTTVLSPTPNESAGANQGFLARKAEPVRHYLRDLSVLMGWGMEDSLETSDAMRARGWGATDRRTTYRRSELRTTDIVLLVILGALIIVNAFFMWKACSQFEFYPAISGFVEWWSYIPHLMFLAFPVVLDIKERISWKR